jgi:ribA/ribD-fused uncharacterized protein
VDDPIYFYTKTGPYFELSNFAPFGLETGGLYWPTVEHYFQAQKFADRTYRERIRQAPTPKEAHALGQGRSVPIRSDWEIVRDDVMLSGLRIKFTRAEVRQLLLSTNDRRLVEASADPYWGGGSDGMGRNRFGELLMQVRRELAAQQRLAADAPKAARR